ncbi:hypothetical protein [Rhodococcus sp. I2R]|uniref:hypothetical protein n=1 Tax=Rhodococcus sp. I2R TaxID=2855445 RepID=UPI001E54E595|nr:hypothetical protein [Rhodococcus sp. I2R]
MAAQQRSRHERGLGYDHVRQRKNLLHQHVDGSPCYWCGEPLFKDPAANWDEQSLAADHSHARALGGTVADRLLHNQCNSQRQDGAHDHERPAVTGVPPWEWRASASSTAPNKRRLGEPNVDLGTRFMPWPDMV